MQDVLGRIKAKEMKPEIEAELREHLLSRMEEHTDRGVDADEAAREAVRQMGASSIVAEHMNRIHRPHIPWLMWISLAIWIGVSLFGLFLLQSEAGVQNSVGLGARSVIFALLGILCFVAGMLIDYRRLRRLAPWMYGGMVIMLVGTGAGMGVTVNGMLSVRRPRPKRYVKLMLYAFTALPVLLYVMDGRFPQLIIYSLGMMLVLRQLRCRPAVWWRLAACAAGGGAVLWLTSDYARSYSADACRNGLNFLEVLGPDSDSRFVMREIHRAVQHIIICYYGSSVRREGSFYGELLIFPRKTL
ncbi:permease prefix domain 1-containing protein [Paenibacillus melissococcoides]|uniref:permease prefix domain 1-containing protein n=1 Tax=Paenibacillus TaxID=44249 RepID=UPI001BCDA863|nr:MULTISPECIES: permease prefix domain 1-containing protein [Paenibacillus]CAH8718485.1 permease prefix domain 1-containing protein [Paenibacillus melissococcoides]CAH8718627.1 permease prefix domain 1-containing protein [Paenibacillus melissococcoides]